MRRWLPTGVAFLAILTAFSNTADAQQKCYTFYNGASHPVTLRFTYDGTIPTNALISQPIAPGKDWQDCVAAGIKITATLEGGVFSDGSGFVIMSQGAAGYPAKTYNIQGQPDAPIVPTAGKCIPNSYPGSSNYCLTWEEKNRTLTCVMGRARSGQQQIVRLKLTCNDGRKWSLTCAASGSPCNLNDNEFCNGLSQWNVGEHCTKKGASPNGELIDDLIVPWEKN